VGYVTEQEIDVRTLQNTCTAGITGPECFAVKSNVTRAVTSYGYLSIQRGITFRPEATLKPIPGLGVVANSNTNPYVSSLLTFSLSAELRVGKRWSVEWRHLSNAGLKQPNLGQDILLLRASFRGPAW
jgi:hypothetical protein